jgi:ABC-type multidrug transport system fused ATPase/permease subunit
MIFSILTPTEKTRLALITLSQFLVSILELIALAATGAVVSLAIRSNDGTGPGDRVQFLLSIINLDNMPAIKLVFIFSVIALLLFTIRTLVSIWFVKHALRFSGAVAARMSAQLSDHYISDLSGKRNLQFNQQEIAYAVTGGSVRLISGTLGTLNMLVADGFLLLIVSGGLLVIDPFSTLIMFFYFLIIVFTMHFFTSLKLRVNSRQGTELSIDSSHYFLETALLFREFKLRSLLTERLSRFANYRESFAKSQAYIQFLPTISKYVLEIALIFGISVISLVQVLNFDVARSFPTLALFIIAASRLAPGIFRLQHNYASFLGAFESTRTTQLILRDLIKTSPNVKKIDLVTNPEASPANYRVDTIANKLQERGIQVSIRNLDFSFSDLGFNGMKRTTSLLRGVNLSLSSNTVNALMGKSGSGKSTLADLIIGVREGFEGEIFLNDCSNVAFITKNPGMVAFVPQNPVLLQGSFRFNIALRENLTIEDDTWINSLLSKLALDDLLSSLGEGLDSEFSFGGRHLSGGQLQRVSLARALFTRPRLLIVDEYTSALDDFTEDIVTQMVQDISASCTVLVISHRKRTIFNCENFYVIKDGSISQFDAFEDASHFQAFG